MVAAVKEVGLAHERYLQDEKRRTGNSKEKDGGGQKGKKRKQDAEKQNAAQKKGDGSKDTSSTGNAKKSKKDSTPAAHTGTLRFTKEQEEEALKGIP